MAFDRKQPAESGKTKRRERRQRTGITSKSGQGKPSIRSLQQILGNQAIQKLVKSGTVQPKLMVSHPSDRSEREADRVAEQVMGMPKDRDETANINRKDPPSVADYGISTFYPAGTAVGDQALRNDELVHSDGAASYQQVGKRIERALGSTLGGRPLPPAVRSFFEPRFGRDFSDVRVHTDREAEDLNRSLNAKAFTHGTDLYFGDGQYRLESTGGKKLIAHELTHVVQQTGNGGAIRRTPGRVIQRDDDRPSIDELRARRLEELFKIWVRHDYQHMSVPLPAPAREQIQYVIRRKLDTKSRETLEWFLNHDDNVRDANGYWLREAIRYRLDRGREAPTREEVPSALTGLSISLPSTTELSAHREAHERVVRRLRFHWRPALGRVFIDVRLPTDDGETRVREDANVYFSDARLRDLDPEAFIDRLIDLSTRVIDELRDLLEIAEGPDRRWIHSFIDYWIRWQSMASQRPTSDARIIWECFDRLSSTLFGAVETVVPDQDVDGEGGTAELTLERRAELQRLAMRMDFDELQRGYEEVNDWISDQDWLGSLKTSIERTDTAVEQAYQAAGRDLPPILERLKLVSKLLSVKDDLDKVMVLVSAGDRVEGRANQRRFASFVEAWHRMGWNDLMTLYRTSRIPDRHPEYRNVTPSRFLELPAPVQVMFALNVAQVLELNPRVRFEVFAAELEETFDIMGELVWWAVEKLFLSRIPGWAVAMLVVDSVGDLIDAFTD